MSDARLELIRLADRLTDLEPAMAGIGMALEALVRDRFDSGHGPGGAAWQPSRRAIATGGTTLVKSGRLRRSITSRASPDSVEIGTDVIYAVIHQEGGGIAPRRAERLLFTTFDGRTVAADRVDIPARPFLGMDEVSWDAVAERLTVHLTGSQTGAEAGP